MCSLEALYPNFRLSQHHQQPFNCWARYPYWKSCPHETWALPYNPIQRICVFSAIRNKRSPGWKKGLFSINTYLMTSDPALWHHSGPSADIMNAICSTKWNKFDNCALNPSETSGIHTAVLRIRQVFNSANGDWTAPIKLRPATSAVPSAI